MSVHDDGGPAYPSLNAEFVGIGSDGKERFETQPSGGMYIRDYFAAKAMQSLVATLAAHELHMIATGEFVTGAAKLGGAAFFLADAMIQARQK